MKPAAYYNEIDPFAAQWLRNLISAGHIAPGDVDERSIEDVTAEDIRGYNQCHFFAGIGVWSYSLRQAGWSDDRPVWTGSCPCQPFSVAGKQAGKSDERHLAPVWLNLIQQCQPAIIFGEQVAAAIGKHWLDDLFTELEKQGYACGAAVLPACSVGAPHIRQRLWFTASRLAITDGIGWERREVPAQGGDNYGEIAGREKGQYGTECSGETGSNRVAVPDSEQHQKRISGLGESHSQKSGGKAVESTRLCLPSGLADTNGDGSQGWVPGGANAQRETEHGSSGCSGADSRPGPVNGFWRSADWLYCRDQKWRAVEPQSFPLVDGATARVGRLRAYGNAINAENAKAFIAACMGAGC